MHKNRLSMNLIDVFVMVAVFLILVNSFHFSFVDRFYYYCVFSIVPFYFFCKNKFGTPKENWLFVLPIWLSILIVLFGFWELLVRGFEFNMRSFLSSSTQLGLILASVSPFYYFKIDSCTGKRIYVLVATLVILFPAIILSGSRTAIIASAVGFACYHLPFEKWKANFIKISFILIVAILAIFLLYSIRPESFDGRVLIWKILFQNLSISLFGNGIGNISALYGSLQAQYFCLGNGSLKELLLAGYSQHAFNFYLKTIYEQGFIGLLLMIFFLVIVIRSFKNNYANCKLGLTVFVIVSICGITSYPFQVPLVIWIFTLSMAHLSHFHLNTYKFILPTKWIKVVSIILLSVICIDGLFYYKNFKIWMNGREYLKYGFHQKALSIYDNHFSYFDNNSSFMLEYGMLLTRVGDYSKGIQTLERSKKMSSDPLIYESLGDCYYHIYDFEKAEENYRINKCLIPHKFYPRLVLIRFFQKTNQLRKLKLEVDEALSVPVKIKSNEVLLILDEIKNISNSVNL